VSCRVSVASSAEPRAARQSPSQFVVAVDQQIPQHSPTDIAHGPLARSTEAQSEACARGRINSVAGWGRSEGGGAPIDNVLKGPERALPLATPPVVPTSTERATAPEGAIQIWTAVL